MDDAPPISPIIPFRDFGWQDDFQQRRGLALGCPLYSRPSYRARHCCMSIALMTGLSKEALLCDAHKSEIYKLAQKPIRAIAPRVRGVQQDTMSLCTPRKRGVVTARHHVLGESPVFYLQWLWLRIDAPLTPLSRESP